MLGLTRMTSGTAVGSSSSAGGCQPPTWLPEVTCRWHAMQLQSNHCQSMGHLAQSKELEGVYTSCGVVMGSDPAPLGRTALLLPMPQLAYQGCTAGARVIGC